MTIDGLDDEIIRRVLTRHRRIALVGASANPDRAAWEIQGLLQRRGYEVTPVNPLLAGQVLQGRDVVARLDDAVPLEIVDVFRASANVPPVVDDAIRLGAKVVWMQLGVVHEQAAARARAAGITVVMDRCPSIEFRRLGIEVSPL
ncbi:MAG: CoA-binding protein [Rhodospirillales bacterium 70-18]|nr:CoA-binding protein [Rhodospirillales bacterium]OJY70295.1 MAG: CoA-binding protein [Rhodospirillales bacterium 70-18]